MINQMKTDNLYVIPLKEQYSRTSCIGMVALFNSDVISEDEVQKLILDHTADTDMRVVVMYKQQYRNLFDKVDISEQTPYNDDEFLEDLHMEQKEQM